MSQGFGELDPVAYNQLGQIIASGGIEAAARYYSKTASPALLAAYILKKFPQSSPAVVKSASDITLTAGQQAAGMVPRSARHITGLRWGELLPGESSPGVPIVYQVSQAGGSQTRAKLLGTTPLLMAPSRPAGAIVPRIFSQSSPAVRSKHIVDVPFPGAGKWVQVTIEGDGIESVWEIWEAAIQEAMQRVSGSPEAFGWNSDDLLWPGVPEIFASFAKY